MRQTFLAVLSLSAMAALLTGCGGDMVLLNSKGPVAEGQSNLMMIAIYLMLLVVIRIKMQNTNLLGHTLRLLKL